MIKSNFRPCGDIGPKGDNGLTPHIGKNGNWYIGEKDTGVKAEGPRGQRGFRGEQGISGTDVNICNTSFAPHTTEQIDYFAFFNHPESFDRSKIEYEGEIKKGDTIVLLIPNSDTGQNSMYFGLIFEMDEHSIQCYGRGSLHSGTMGKQGPPGPQGQKGQDGRPSNIIGLHVDERGHLIAEFQDV